MRVTTQSPVARLVGIVGVTVGAMAVSFGVGAFIGGLNVGGFRGAGIGLLFALLLFAPGVPLLLLGLRLVRKPRST